MKEYNRDKLERDHYIPDIRYLRDESKAKKHDWTKDSDESDESEQP